MNPRTSFVVPRGAPPRSAPLRSLQGWSAQTLLTPRAGGHGGEQAGVRRDPLGGGQGEGPVGTAKEVLGTKEVLGN